ncbi:DNA topoisomerase II [Listeria phage LIS04]|nr:DNA topoisomerase II [Listeria phage LIS04]
MGSDLQITSSEASQVASELYTHYAKYVIETRALASVYDGFKAVQRRILYVLATQPDKLTKSANIVGETIKYHPHGDASIYGTLVNMGSPLNKVPIIKTKGNFGGVGTGAAAMRYTECKLSELGRKVFTELLPYADYVEGETGHKEPAYIPVLIPYALFEGTSGIGVGLSASSPPLNPVELTQYYISKIKGEDAVIPRPDFGELILDQPREEVEQVLLTGRGRLKFQGVLHQEGETKFSVTNLPPDIKMKSILKKVEKWIDDDKLDHVDLSVKTRNNVFKVVSNKLDPKEVKKKLTSALSRAKTYNFVFSQDEKAVYCGIDYMVTKSLEYFTTCVVRKFKDLHAKSTRLYEVLDAIQALKDSGKVKDLPSMSRQDVISLIVEDLGFSERVAKEVLSKSISYLTKDHGSEMEDLLKKVDKYQKYIDNPNLYILPLYEELLATFKELYKNTPVTYYGSEKLDNPKAFVNDSGKVQVTKDQGVEWDSKLYLVDNTGMTYPRIVDTWTETELEFGDITTPLIGLVSDSCKYLLYVIESEGSSTHKLLAVSTDKIGYTRNFVKLKDTEKVVSVVGCKKEKINLKTTNGDKIEISPKFYLKSRYSVPVSTSHLFDLSGK